MAFLYILECTDGTLYTGIAADIKRRMAEHKKGSTKCAKYTRAHPMRRLRIYWETDSLANAAKGEYAVKQLPRKKKEELIAEPARLKEFCPRLAEYQFIPRTVTDLSSLPSKEDAEKTKGDSMNIFGNTKKLGFGMMRLPLTDPADAGSIDIETTKKMVDTFLAAGFTYFDTAVMYCQFKSESALKTALTDRYPRERYTVATKLHAGFVKDNADCDRYFAEQKAKIGVDYFDYYLLHDIGEDHYRKYQELDAFRWLEARKAAGDVRHIGFSYHDNAALLDKVLTEHPEMEFVQLQINYLDWDSEGIQARQCYEIAVKHGKPVIVMEPVKGGTLANVPEQTEKAFHAYAPQLSTASWAIRFAASLPQVAVVLSGMSDMAQLTDNISYMQDFTPLNQEEQQLIVKAVEDINASIAIPCTGCGYCTSGCPQNIAIPRYFSLYNADLQECKEKGWTPQKEYYDRAILSFGKAGQCEACGRCEDICPQHLPIIKHLKTVADYFES